MIFENSAFIRIENDSIFRSLSLASHDHPVEAFIFLLLPSRRFITDFGEKMTIIGEGRRDYEV